MSPARPWGWMCLSEPSDGKGWVCADVEQNIWARSFCSAGREEERSGLGEREGKDGARDGDDAGRLWGMAEGQDKARAPSLGLGSQRSPNQPRAMWQRAPGCVASPAADLSGPASLPQSLPYLRPGNGDALHHTLKFKHALQVYSPQWNRRTRLRAST